MRCSIWPDVVAIGCHKIYQAMENVSSILEHLPLSENWYGKVSPSFTNLPHWMQGEEQEP